MSSSDAIRTIETHTEGMPTRIIVGGAPAIPGATMRERFAFADRHLHNLRGLLMNEPRGHAAMFGALLVPAARADADCGVIYMSASGFVPMCGHGTIGLATALVEKGMVSVREPVTEVRLDTPVGLVLASVEVASGKSRAVTMTNVPSFVAAEDVRLDIPNFGAATVDVAYGGNFYVILDVAQLGKSLSIDALPELMDLGLAAIRAARESVPIIHPDDTQASVLKAAVLTEAATATAPAKNLMVKEPRYFDRSPCGTGTSARMALEYRKGRLGLRQAFLHESILGTAFEGKLIEETKVGRMTAVVPQIKGRAWITGASEFVIDPSDPFPTGFKF
ncbi:MAG: proline racemase family protein [Rhizobiales bacterium]|nr:proline racemase family protein [Hyphomicrobiales bacterium]